ncbi:DUF2336 domain-containing protein [Maricaulis salignorans]|uniref:Uncharacterized conserved protein, DUF2336 family n=1 Tax=Maricaulis salignorans TaxID=144026 RepID=A0A1G9U7Y4_9PROT|nr:DUF2336 domain-containing protein [Maricaulis salignorans]SDM56116.1 Uncharacterized conserved protein, DUF2336 family [Maricaulis salignorans]
MTVVALRNRLTETDVRRLVRGQTDEERALAARKICHRIDAASLSDVERAAARDILDLIARDAAELVRRALAVTLRQSPNLPRDIAVKLASDVDSVAAPVLLSSPSLTDEDLIEILHGASSAKFCAVAARDQVSAIVVHEILDSKDEGAVGIAASNDGAEFDEAAYQRAFSEFCECQAVMDAFVARSHLPLDITERLISHISDQALDRLVKNHALPPQLAVEIAEGARERATVDLVDQAGLAHDPKHFVQQLRMNSRLTPSLILRALFRGHVAFVEHAFAELSGLPHAKAWLLVHDAGPLGLRAIYDRTGMPPRLYPAIRAGLDVYHSTEMPHDGESREHFRRVLAERAITRFQGIPEEDLDYMLRRFAEDAQPLAAAG